MNIAGLSISRPVFISMITVCFVVFGLLALPKLPVDLYPSISYPVLAVRADLRGAAPEEVEQLVTRRIEDTLSTVSDVATLRSISREGSAIISLEFNQGADIKFQEIQVRAKVANIRRSLPANLSEPVVFRQDPDDTPIIEVALTGNRPASELSDLADNVVGQKIRQLAGVGDVQISGQRREEIIAELKPEALQAWHINGSDVVAALGRSNRNDPVGRIEGNTQKWLVRAVAQATTLNELLDIPVGRSPDGQPLFVRDVATLSHEYAKAERVTRFSDGKGMTPTVILQILKQSGENTVAISDRVRASLKDFEGVLPPDISLRVTRDNADLIRDNVADVYESLVIACILTIVVVLLFLRSPRSTITTGLSLPSSVITTFAVMAVAGFTINVMTLLALSLSIGLLVDDAIVVRENIFRHLHMGRLSGKEAALKGTQEVSLAVVATTLTVVAVFLPVAFMGGVTGQFFKPFALTVVFAMLVSLWDALTMAPMLSAYFANIPNPADEWRILGLPGRLFHRLLELFEHSFDVFSRAYTWVLNRILPRPWVALLVMALSLWAAKYGFDAIPKTFLPQQLGSTFRASLDGPNSVTTDTVQKVAEEAQKRLEGIPSLEFWTLTGGVDFSGSASVDFTLHVKPFAAKNQESLARVREQVRSALSGFTGYNPRISEPADPLAAGGGRFRPVQVNVTGDDPQALLATAKKVRALMQQIPDITDVGTLQEDGQPELQFRINRPMAARYGLTPDQIATQLSIWVQGDSTNVLRVGDGQIPIRITSPEGSQMTADDLMLKTIMVRGQGTSGRGDVFVPLKSVVSLVPAAGPSLINRENRSRVLRVGAGIRQGAALGGIVQELKSQLANLPRPTGVNLQITGQSQQMDELYQNVTKAIVLGSLFMFMVLASLFESFIHPFAVMVAVPLAATGAVWALIGMGLPMDLYAGIGMVLLAGIVAKNSILLVDFALQKVAEGVSPFEAMREAAPLRLRPILMTSLAMIVGMLPVAMAMGAGGAARQSLGVATIGGVLSSTVLTLLVVPNVWLLLEKARQKVLRPKK